MVPLQGRASLSLSITSCFPGTGQTPRNVCCRIHDGNMRSQHLNASRESGASRGLQISNTETAPYASDPVTAPRH